MNEETWEQIQAAFDELPSEGFMQPQLERPQRLWRIEIVRGHFDGVAICSADELCDISYQSTGLVAEFLGVLPRVRLSAPGYMDTTDWWPVASLEELDEWTAIYCGLEEQ